MTCPDLVLLFSNISKEIALSSCHLSIVILSVFAHAFSSVFFPWKYLKWELSSYIANTSKKALTDITFHQNCSHFGADVLTKLKAVQPGFFSFFANASVVWSCTRESAKFCNWNQNCWSDAFSTLSQPKVLNHLYHLKKERRLFATNCNVHLPLAFHCDLWSGQFIADTFSNISHNFGLRKNRNCVDNQHKSETCHYYWACLSFPGFLQIF